MTGFDLKDHHQVREQLRSKIKHYFLYLFVLHIYLCIYFIVIYYYYYYYSYLRFYIIFSFIFTSSVCFQRCELPVSLHFPIVGLSEALSKHKSFDKTNSSLSVSYHIYKDFQIIK